MITCRILVFILVMSSSSLWSQHYMWNYSGHGNYISDYDGVYEKQILPATYVPGDGLEVDTLNQLIFIHNNTSVRVFTMEGEMVRTIPFRTTHEIHRIQIDPIKQHIYFLYEEFSDISIRRMNYFGKEEVVLVDDLEVSIYHLMLDMFRSRIYVGEESGDNINYFYYDIHDLSKHSAFTLGKNARNLYLDKATNTLYYSDIQKDQFIEWPLDSWSNRILFDYSNTSMWTHDVEFDPTHKTVYFQDGKSDALFSYDWENNLLVEEFDIYGNVEAMRLAEDRLFFIQYDYAESLLNEYDIHAKSLRQLAESEETLSISKVDEEEGYYVGTRSGGRICTYGMDGTFLKEHTKRTFAPIEKMIFIDGRFYINDGRSLFSMNEDFEDLQFHRRLKGLTVDYFTYNPNDNKLYFALTYEGQIWKCNLDGSEYELVYELKSHESTDDYLFAEIVYSAYDDKLYLTGRGSRKLMSMSPDGSNFTYHLTSNYSDNLHSLVADDTGQFLFYIKSEDDILYRMDVETGERTVHATNLPSSARVVYNIDGDDLYALGYEEKTIFRINDEGVIPLHTYEDYRPTRAFVLKDGELISGLYNTHESIIKINASSGALETLHNRHQTTGPDEYLDKEENELYGTVRSGFNNNNYLLFKIDLDTDSITYFYDINPWEGFAVYPEHHTCYYLSRTDFEKYVMRVNLSDGTRDSLQYFPEGSNKYVELVRHPGNQRMYISNISSSERLFSIDSAGIDMVLEANPQNSGILRPVLINPVDSTFTVVNSSFFHDLFSRVKISTGEVSNHGIKRRELSRSRWNVIDSYFDKDEDGDGYSFVYDCDDNDASIHPGMPEIPDNNIDENCDGILGITDEDGDGIGILYDCNDQDSLVNLYAEEIPNNDVDENCDGVLLIIDEDGDGYNSSVDCDDTDAEINPGADEIPDNYIDENCDGVLEGIDADGDGFFAGDDCDDFNADVNPDAQEIVYNGIDDDCDETTPDDDLDYDGYPMHLDCDDTNSNINPGIEEIPYNGLDDDCNPSTYDDDLDQDGYLLEDDCNDENYWVNPDQEEIVYNGLDDDCDESTLDDDLDQDGYVLAEDCDDADANIHPGAEEIPDNDIDENCDGIILITSTSSTEQERLVIYPNPTTGIFRIGMGSTSISTTEIYNTRGLLLKITEGSSVLDISEFPSGVYLLKIKVEEKWYFGRLIKV